MFEITFIGSFIVVVFLALLYFLAHKSTKLFNELFTITREESQQHIDNFTTITNDLIEQIKYINENSVERLDQNTHIIKELNTNLSQVIQQIKSIEQHLDQIDEKVINRKDLEGEIIKLKNIIKRLEKKNG